MLTWYAAAPSPSGLLEVTLQPAEPSEHKGIEHERAIRTLRGRSNRVQLGVPQTRDILSAWPMTEQLEAEIAAAGKAFDFCCVRMACSPLPDRGWHLHGCGST